MEIKHVSEKDYNLETASGVVLVDFYTEWCGPCKMLAPVLENLAEQRSDVKIIKVNADQEGKLSQDFGIMSIPTLILYNDGKIVDKRMGYQPIDMLNDWIAKATVKVKED